MSAPAALSPGLIIVNAWYGKFVNDKSRKKERVKVIDVTVPLQCLVKDSKLILTEASKVQRQVISATCPRVQLHVTRTARPLCPDSCCAGAAKLPGASRHLAKPSWRLCFLSAGF